MCVWINTALFVPYNCQTMPELRDDISKHRLKDMLAHGLCVSICTDNRLVSNTTVVKELLLAIGACIMDGRMLFISLVKLISLNLKPCTHTEHFALTPAELKTIILEGVKRSFFGGSYLQKRAYVKRFLHYYEVRQSFYRV